MSDGGGGGGPKAAAAPASPPLGAPAGDAAGVAPVVEGEDGAAAASKEAKWFELVPVILANIGARGTEKPTELARPRCARCEQQGVAEPPIAEIKCLDDECAVSRLPTCAACFIRVHAPMKDASHGVEDMSKCPLCQEDHVEFYCMECKLVFCEVCISRIHSVARVRNHRRFPIEGCAGQALAKGSWSAQLHASVMQRVAVMKRPYAKDVSTVNGKRKRNPEDVEVITIDSDTEDSEPPPPPKLPAPSYIKPGFQPPRDAQSYQANSMIRPTPPAESDASSMIVRVQHVVDHLQPPVTGFSSVSAHPRPARPEPPMPEPIPFPQELMTTSLQPPTTTPGQSIGGQNPYSDPGLHQGINPATSSGFGVPPIQTSVPMTTSTTGWSPGSTPTASDGPNSAAIYVNNATTAGLMMAAMPGAAIASGNPVLDTLLDRYDITNRTVFNLECRIQQLNQEIVAATSRGPYAAAPFMAQLAERQQELQVAMARRDRMFAIVLVQSPNLIRRVRQLRVDELVDVPQVPPLSHRKCLQLNFTINKHKASLATMNQNLAIAIASSNTASSNAAIQTISKSIATDEQAIASLTEARDSEFLRIVQFSDSIRNAIKLEFRRFQLQQQQQLQQQHQQQQHTPTAPY